MQEAKKAESLDPAKIQRLRKQLFDNLVTLDELLEAFAGRFSRASVYTWINRDRMPHRKIRGRLFFDPSEVALWLRRSSQ